MSAAPAEVESLAEFLASCKYDPLRHVLGSYPWGVPGTPLEGMKLRDWQYKELESIGERLMIDPYYPIRDAFGTGHGVGKSALAAMLVKWALDCWLEARVVVTANTEGQLRNKTWAEMSKWHNMSLTKDFFNCGKTAIFSTEKHLEMTWRADAVPWSEHNPEAFAGLHNAGKLVMVIMDEASAIPDIIHEVTEGAMTDENTVIIWVQFGNTTRNTGRFKECAPGGRLAEQWNFTHLDARTIEGTNKKQLDEWVELWGEDSDFVRIRVRGEFPRQGDKQFISGEVIDQAAKRPPHREATDALIMGVDVARFGSNKTIFSFRAGRDAESIPWIKLRKLDAQQVAARIMEQIEKHQPDAVFIDGDGIGGPVYDIVRSHHFDIISVNSGKLADEENLWAQQAGGDVGSDA